MADRVAELAEMVGAALAEPAPDNLVAAIEIRGDGAVVVELVDGRRIEAARSDDLPWHIRGRRDRPVTGPELIELFVALGSMSPGPRPGRYLSRKIRVADDKPARVFFSEAGR